MDNLLINDQSLAIDLQILETNAFNLSRGLGSLKQVIRYIFSKIQTSDSLHEANVYFDLLQKIQHVLSIILYKEALGLSEEFRSFVRDFDRIDDPDCRTVIFCAIKEKNYSFGKNLFC